MPPTLLRKVRDVTSQLSSEHRDLHGTVSKVGKAIDRSFVSGMLADRDKIAIVRAILGLAQALGMKTTAEGIETVELGQTLAALGCSHGQGYYYARPLDPEAAWAMIADQA